MKKHSFNKILSPLSRTFMALALTASMGACDNAIYDYDEDCPPEEEPAPGPGGTVIVTPDEDVIRISVRVNPGSGGTAAVADDGDASNAESTTEGAYVSIVMEENGTYTLTATETNPEYTFVKWHDDTNDGDLTEGVKVISGLVAVESVKYTAIFALPEEPAEPEPDPELGQYYAKFVFDMNMQFTDGFSQRVRSVDLYVFNPNGAFVTKYHEDGLPLTDPEYLMELTDLPAGEYEFIAWCGLTNNNGHFTVPADATIDRNTSVVCSMATNSDATHGAYQNANLSPLFHGRKTDAKYVEKTTEKQIQTVYLTKNTNNVNITLQHRDGLEFDKSRFTVTMHDQNDVMHHDNAVRTATSQEVQYRPYRTAIGNTNSKSRAEGSTTTGNFMQVELATARLLTSNNPMITVTDNESGKNIFSIPLVKWATQLRSANSKTLVPDDQEYLDREDNYNLMLWMDSNDEGWFGAEININDWHVVDDTTAIK